jgi:hypothetical protein
MIMKNSDKVNKIILETINKLTDDKALIDLITECISFEIDTSNRHILPLTIKSEYNEILRKIYKVK